MKKILLSIIPIAHIILTLNYYFKWFDIWSWFHWLAIATLLYAVFILSDLWKSDLKSGQKWHHTFWLVSFVPYGLYYLWKTSDKEHNLNKASKTERNE